jgi:tRNA/tmRNA/rRNA uracil-C5-methylase (TrmA/RlmC/RlmD family)
MANFSTARHQLHNYLVIARKTLPGEETPISVFDSKTSYAEAKKLADWMADKEGWQCVVVELEYITRLYERDWPFQKQ